MSAPTTWLRLEAAAALVLTLLLYHEHGAGWLLFAILFLAPDVSLAGYLANPSSGARIYNLAHTYTLSLLVVGGALAVENRIALAVGMIWTAHIAFDRMLGYGLKLPTGFHDTHLGRIGDRGAAHGGR